jgi:DNA-binding XRE family transcriptional regulator
MAATSAAWSARGDIAYRHSVAVNFAVMRALPLTDKSRPGGRPRDERTPLNAFGTWLLSCKMTPAKVAEKLGVSVSSVYNARNGYYTPGLDLANRIAKLSKGKVPTSSWAPSKARRARA